MLETALRHESTARSPIRYPRGAGVGVATDRRRCTRSRSAAARCCATAPTSRSSPSGTMVLPAERAADLLAAEGIAATVVNARFVKPLDERLILELAARCGAIVTVEENVGAGGFGSAVLELLHEPGCRCADSSSRGPRPRLRAGVSGPAPRAGRAHARAHRAGGAPAGRLKQDSASHDALSHRASLSGRLGGIGSVPRRSAGRAFDTGEAIVNPIGGASSLSATGRDRRRHRSISRPARIGPAWRTPSGRIGVSLDAEALWRASPATAIFSSTEAAVQPDGDPRPRRRSSGGSSSTRSPWCRSSTASRALAAERADRPRPIGRRRSRRRVSWTCPEDRPPRSRCHARRRHRQESRASSTRSSRRLGLDDVRAVQGRAEELGHDSGVPRRGSMSPPRAPSPASPVLLEYVVPFLTIGGTALLPKGLQIDRRAAARPARRGRFSEPRSSRRIALPVE